MSEVDTVRMVSSLAALIEINLPFLSNRIDESKGNSVSNELSRLENDLLFGDGKSYQSSSDEINPEIDTLVDDLYNRLFSNVRVSSKDEEDYRLILGKAFQRLSNPIFSGRYKENLEREKVLWYSLKENELKNFLPVFVRGYSIIDNMRNKKGGIDPYSGLSYFSDILLKSFPSQLNPEILGKIALIYVQPNTFVQFFNRKDNEKVEGAYELVDITEGRTSGKFGLKKTFEMETKKVFSEYNPELFDTQLLDKHFRFSWKSYLSDMDLYGLQNESIARLREILRKRTVVAQRIMALKFAEITNLYYEDFKKQIDAFELESLPLYMEKTSGDNKIFGFVNDYLRKPIEFKPIGGDLGPLEGQYKNLPVKGICEGKALRKLLGFLQSLSPPKESPTLLKFISKDSNLEYIFESEYPYLLIESNAFDKHPNLIDHAKAVLGGKNNPKRQLVEEYCNYLSLGISRVEPRLVELFNSNRSINKGLQSISKVKIPFQKYMENKEILFPMDIPGFEKLVSKENREKAFFRGSLFSLPTTEKLRKSLFNFKKAYQNIDGGCPIDKWISLSLNNNDLEQIIEGYKPSDSAERGTLIHSLISAPIEGDVEDNPHYNTLRRIGVEPRPSSDYCELKFTTEYEGRSISFHPDVLLFLKDKTKENFDIMIIDTKSSRYTPYLEHRYLLQTLFYAKQIGKQMEEKLGIGYGNIILGLNKMAFFKEHDKGYVQSPYKTQKFSPLILIDKDDPLNQVTDRVFEESIKGMERARSPSTKEEARDFILREYQNSHEEKNYCARCYSDHKKVCKALRENPELLSKKNKELTFKS
jgi:hypothetical protein